jgi:hypothetical protein
MLIAIGQVVLHEIAQLFAITAVENLKPGPRLDGPLQFLAIRLLRRRSYSASTP